MKRLSLLLLFLAFCGAGAYYIYSQEQGKAAPASRAAHDAPVLAAEAVAKPMPVQIATVGRIQTIANVAVRSRIDGVITGVSVEDGQDVKAGDILFTLDDRQAQAQLRLAEANLARDRAQLANAKREVERLIPLAQKNYATKQQLDQLRTNVAALDATVAGDEAQVEANKVQLSYTVIHAPIDGRVGTIASKLGNSIRANDTTPLVTINQLRPIYAAFAVPQRNLADLQDAMARGPLPVTVTIPGSAGPPQTGQVSYIENAVDPATNTLSVKATFPNAEARLWPGQFVNVVVTLKVEPAAIVVPAEAVQTSQQGPYVFVIKPDSTVEMRPVVVDRTMAGQAVIGKGLAAGLRVVTEGQLRLQPGTRVEVKQPEDEAGAKPETVS